MGTTTVVGQCGGGVGFFRVVADVDGTGEAGVESTVITGTVCSTRCALVEGCGTTDECEVVIEKRLLAGWSTGSRGISG